MPSLESMAYPNAVDVVLDMLADVAQARTSVPPNHDVGTLLITVRRAGGGPDEDDVTDNPIMQIGCYGPDFLAASELAQAVQVRILSSPLTSVNGVLVDEARVVTGEQEVPDVYPDDRRIVSTYQFGWRRQFRPS